MTGLEEKEKLQEVLSKIMHSEYIVSLNAGVEDTRIERFVCPDMVLKVNASLERSTKICSVHVEVPENFTESLRASSGSMSTRGWVEPGARSDRRMVAVNICIFTSILRGREFLIDIALCSVAWRGGVIRRMWLEKGKDSGR